MNDSLFVYLCKNIKRIYRMDKRLFSATVLLPLSLGACTQITEELPNVIFILADDLGIGDLGCYGQTRIKTPYIDSLAAEGMIFANHYAGSTVSAPSRCVLMTGKHTGHSYIRGNKGVPDAATNTHFDYPLKDSEITVAEVFKQKGYSTACVGKWGLGGPSNEGHPNNQGFDYFFGYLGQGRAHRYYPDYLWENRQQVILNEEVYSHDLIMDKALRFIDRNSGSPFFLYLTPTIPHADLDVPDLGEYDGMFNEKPYINRSKDGKGYHGQPKPRAAYAAMVSRLDKGVGMIMKLLEEKGIDKNTIIIFSSDNGVHAEGGHDPEFFNSNSGFKGKKRDLYEGGIHTPFIVHWPAKIPAGSTTGHLSSFWDFMPTICDIIDAEEPAGVDGISYMPTLQQQDRKQKKHDYLYYEFHEKGGKRALLKDGWKLVELNVNDPENSSTELYNLNEDPAEEKNIIGQNGKLAAKMQKIMYKARTDNPVWNFTPDAP